MWYSKDIALLISIMWRPRIYIGEDVVVSLKVLLSEVCKEYGDELEDINRVYLMWKSPLVTITISFELSISLNWIKLFFEAGNRLSALSLSTDKKIINHFYGHDMIWKTLQLEDNFWAFLPALCIQRESFSDIEQRVVAYGV